MTQKDIEPMITIKPNNKYSCLMLLPNINYWYDERSLFFGWLYWGFNIDFD